MNKLGLTTDQISLIERAKEFACYAHLSTNHTYDDMLYDYHLRQVVKVAESFLYHIPNHHKGDVLAACWLHDVMEDCRINYNEIKKEFNLHVAELVYALTNNKGRTRKERAGYRYYEGIRKTPQATFIKLCDRLANAKYSEEKQSRMYSVYKKENPNFIRALWNDQYVDMFVELRKILDKNFQNALL